MLPHRLRRHARGRHHRAAPRRDTRLATPRRREESDLGRRRLQVHTARPPPPRPRPERHRPRRPGREVPGAGRRDPSRPGSEPGPTTDAGSVGRTPGGGLHHGIDHGAATHPVPNPTALGTADRPPRHGTSTTERTHDRRTRPARHDARQDRCRYRRRRCRRDPRPEPPALRGRVRQRVRHPPADHRSGRSIHTPPRAAPHVSPVPPVPRNADPAGGGSGRPTGHAPRRALGFADGDRDARRHR